MGTLGFPVTFKYAVWCVLVGMPGWEWAGTVDDPSLIGRHWKIAACEFLEDDRDDARMLP
jgi:hypothetical protein